MDREQLAEEDNQKRRKKFCDAFWNNPHERKAVVVRYIKTLFDEDIEAAIQTVAGALIMPGSLQEGGKLLAKAVSWAADLEVPEYTGEEFQAMNEKVREELKAEVTNDEETRGVPAAYVRLASRAGFV